MLCTLHVLFKGFYKEIANSWEETSYIKYSFMSPLALDRVYIKTEKSRSMSEFLLYHYLWVTEVDALFDSPAWSALQNSSYTSTVIPTLVTQISMITSTALSIICCAFALIMF